MEAMSSEHGSRLRGARAWARRAAARWRERSMMCVVREVSLWWSRASERERRATNRVCGRAGRGTLLNAGFLFDEVSFWTQVSFSTWTRWRCFLSFARQSGEPIAWGGLKVTWKFCHTKKCPRFVLFSCRRSYKSELALLVISFESLFCWIVGKDKYVCSTLLAFMVGCGLSPLPLAAHLCSLFHPSQLICDFLLFVLIVKSLGKTNISLRSFSFLQSSLTTTPLSLFMISFYALYILNRWKEKYLSSALGIAN
jgi:hypothetical protein